MDAEIWHKASQLAQAGRAFALAIVAESSGSVPRRAGSGMLVTADGTTMGTVGGGKIERIARDEALAALRENQPQLKSYTLDDPEGVETGAICGGALTVFLLPHPARMTLHLFGAGHVARPTCHLAATVGYSVLVYDDTDQWANARDFPDAAGFVIGDYVKSVSTLEFGPKDAVVILSGSHERDLEVLRKFKGKLPPYLGVIASRKKAVHFQAKLQEDGWSEPEIAAVHSPIGLQIGSRTPEEIAVSIVAEIMSVRGPVE